MMQLQAAPAPRRWRQAVAAIRASLWLTAGLLFVDVAFYGSFLSSYLVCPVWFLVSIVKNLIQRPGWGVAVVRIALPVLTLGVAIGNNNLQWKIAEANAERVIKACDEFRVANGRYPKTLDELVPQYLESVPPAKHCLMCGDFWYFHTDGVRTSLLWFKIPPFGRKFYNFEERRWSYVD